VKTATEIIREIETTGLVAIIRASGSDELVEVVNALRAGGVTCIEVTMTTPNALEVIRAARKTVGDSAAIGVGTVLDSETARAAILAGAQFVVAPITDLSTIEICNRYSVPVMPGAFTPTEIVRAWQAGADFVKVFPTSTVGAEYIKDIRGPLPHIKLMPVGGVSVENCGEFIKAGAAAVTAASCIAPKKDIAAGNWDVITGLAARMIANIKAARNK